VTAAVTPVADLDKLAWQAQGEYQVVTDGTCLYMRERKGSMIWGCRPLTKRDCPVHILVPFIYSVRSISRVPLFAGEGLVAGAGDGAVFGFGVVLPAAS
jgi:hypothetical protein